MIFDRTQMNPAYAQKIAQLVKKFILIDWQYLLNFKLLQVIIITT